jgi:hypothetical protein
VRRTFLLVLVLAAALAGCGGGDDPVTIDHTVVETGIETGIARQQHVIAIVSCPPDIAAKKGTRFKCTATLRSGRQEPISVVATDDTGNVHYEGFRGYVNGKPGQK